MTTSSRRAEVVPVTLEKIPNSDHLSLARVFGWTVVTRTDSWANQRPDENGQYKGVFIPPDTLCDVRRPEFSFLSDKAKADGKARIKAIKLRGVQSFGLLLQAPDDVPMGADLWENLQLEHYEPPLPGEGRKGLFLGGEAAVPPKGFPVLPKYDLENFRRYGQQCFIQGEPVYVSQKADGACMRVVYWDGVFHVGSRSEWKKEFLEYNHVTLDFLKGRGVDEEKAKEVLDKLHSKPIRRNLWWDVFQKTEPLQKFCRDNPGALVYGEAFGNVNCIKSGFPDGNRFMAFDVWHDGKFMDSVAARLFTYEFADYFPWLPLFHDLHKPIPFDFEQIAALADGPSIIPDEKPGTIREGIVVVPAQERFHEKIGRVKLKAVSADFLEKYR